MDRKVDIHKAAGVLIKDRKFLVARSRGKEIFVSPGGKLEPGEAPAAALLRELHEELSLVAAPEDLAPFGTFYADAAGMERTRIQIDVFIVLRWAGEIAASGEIEELLWIDSRIPNGIKVGSVFEHEVLPRLKAADLID